MSGIKLTALGDRKELLVMRANLDRIRVNFAVHEVMALASPPRDTPRAGALRPTASMIAAIAIPILGMTRFARWLRVATVVMTVVRVARNWNSSR
jgi:hypothetical protein